MNVSRMNKDDVIKSIVNQANALNKKIKSFRKEGIFEHEQYVHTLLGHNGKYNKSGSITKSVKHYDKINVLELRKTLVALHKLNNHDMYGTVNKYNKVMTRQYKDIEEYTRGLLEKKGYSDDFISNLLADKTFYDKLVTNFNNGLQGGTSDTVIEKVAIEYQDTKYKTKEMDKTIANIEHSVNKANQLRREKELLEQYRRDMARR